MGIKERRQRERQQLKNGILAAAREIAATEGWRAVTIRKIAERIEYSPPVLYEYFDSKDEILLELVRLGYARQLEAVESAREASSGGPEEVLLAMARAWCAFAFRSPDLYQVMYGLGGVSFPAAELRREGEKIAEPMERTIMEVLRKNGKAATGAWDEVVIGWGTLHGLVALAMAGRIPGGREEAERLVDRAMRHFLAAWIGA